MMPIRSLSFRLVAAALFLISPALQAQEPAPEATASPMPQTLEQAAAQRALATEMRNTADKRLAEEQAACYKKILVNSCLDDAKKSHTQAMIDARKVDNPARDFQREAHRAEVEARAAQRAADAPGRTAEQQAQGERYRAEQAAKDAEREKKLAEREQKAAEGRQRLAEEQAQRQERLAARAKKDAERAARRLKDENAAAAAGDTAR